MSVEQIHQLRKRSNQFVQDLEKHISDVIEHNEKLLQLNKAQLKASKNAKGGPLVNLKTGSANLSPAYAKRKGKRKPDWFDTGATFREMDILVNEPDEYFITSYTDYTRHLVEMYLDGFGINDKKKAQSIVVPMLAEKFKQLVL